MSRSAPDTTVSTVRFGLSRSHHDVSSRIGRASENRILPSVLRTTRISAFTSMIRRMQGIETSSSFVHLPSAAFSTHFFSLRVKGCISTPVETAPETDPSAVSRPARPPSTSNWLLVSPRSIAMASAGPSAPPKRSTETDRRKLASRFAAGNSPVICSVSARATPHATNTSANAPKMLDPRTTGPLPATPRRKLPRSRHNGQRAAQKIV